MASRTSRRLLLDAAARLLPAVVVACGVRSPAGGGGGGATGDGDGAVGSEAGEADSAGGSGDGEADTGDEEWPLCEPRVIDYFEFGPDPEAEPAEQWGESYGVALCTLVSFDQTDDGFGDFRHRIDLEDCVDDQGAAVSESLDVLVVIGDDPLQANVTNGQQVRVTYARRKFPGLVDEYWLALRDPASDELLLAAFVEGGPTIEPKADRQAPWADWLSPLQATVGEQVCPRQWDEAGCTERGRAAVDFVAEDATVSIVAGTVRDVGEYRVHMGEAGHLLEACAVGPSPPVQGVVVKRPR